MPYSDAHRMPALVYPDTPISREYVYREVLPKNPELWQKVYYCLEWKPRWDNKAKCENANPAGYFNNNHCFRCPAGYIFFNMTEKESENKKIGISLSGW